MAEFHYATEHMQILIIRTLLINRTILNAQANAIFEVTNVNRSDIFLEDWLCTLPCTTCMVDFSKNLKVQTEAVTTQSKIVELLY